MICGVVHIKLNQLVYANVHTKGVRRVLVRGVNAPWPPEAKKILKI